MFAEEVAQYLNLQGVGLYKSNDTGGNIFVGFLPNSPDTAIAVLQTGGDTAPIALQQSVESLRVIVRGGFDTVEASALADKVQKALHGVRDTRLVPGGQWVCAIHAHIPAGLGMDANGRHEYSVNLEALVTRR